MKKVICALGALVYTSVVSYLLFLLMWWLSFYYFNSEWQEYVLIVILAPIAAKLLVGLMSIIMIPCAKLIKENKTAKIAILIPALFYGIRTMAIPWVYGDIHGLLLWVCAIVFVVASYFLFSNLVMVLYICSSSLESNDRRSKILDIINQRV